MFEHPFIVNVTCQPEQTLFSIRGRKGDYVYDRKEQITYSIAPNKKVRKVRSTTAITETGKTATVLLTAKVLEPLFYGAEVKEKESKPSEPTEVKPKAKPKDITYADLATRTLTPQPFAQMSAYDITKGLELLRGKADVLMLTVGECPMTTRYVHVGTVVGLMSGIHCLGFRLNAVKWRTDTAIHVFPPEEVEDQMYLYNDVVYVDVQNKIIWFNGDATQDGSWSDQYADERIEIVAVYKNQIVFRANTRDYKEAMKLVGEAADKILAKAAKSIPSENYDRNSLITSTLIAGYSEFGVGHQVHGCIMMLGRTR